MLSRLWFVRRLGEKSEKLGSFAWIGFLGGYGKILNKRSERAGGYFRYLVNDLWPFDRLLLFWSINVRRKSEKIGRKRQKQIKNASLTNFDPLVFYLFFAPFFKACFAEILLYLWQAAKNALKCAALKCKSPINILVPFITCSFWK